jgi:hypothetical protein
VATDLDFLNHTAQRANLSPRLRAQYRGFEHACAQRCKFVVDRLIARWPAFSQSVEPLDKHLNQPESL